MRPEPSAGFNASFETPVRQIAFRAEIDSHNFLSADSQDGFVSASSVNVYSARVTFASTTAIDSVSIFLARISGLGQYVDIRILGESGGAPDTGNVIASASIPVLRSKRPRFYRASFIESIYADSGLTADSGLFADAGAASKWIASAGVPYWIEITPQSGTVVKWFKKSSASGQKFALGTTVTSDQALIFKTRSVTAADNLFSLSDLSKFQITLTKKIDSDSGSLEIRNVDRKYSELQPLRWLFDQDAEVSLWIGNGTSELNVAKMLVRDYSIQTDQVTVSLLAKNAKGIVQKPLLKSSFVGSDLSVVLKDLLDQASIPYVNSDIQSTGKNWPSYGTVESTIMETLQKITEAANFELKFSGDGFASFESRPTVFLPDYQLRSDKHLKDRSISTTTSTDSIVNRALIHNGQTSDGADLSFNAATVIQNFNGGISLATRSVTKSVQFSSPTYRVEIRDTVQNGAIAISELSRTSNEISFLIINAHYPNASVTYDVDVYGQTIQNSSASLKIYEKSRPNSINDIGIFDYLTENTLFGEIVDIQHTINDLTLFNALPRQFMNVRTRGVPTLEVGDIVSIDHVDVNPDLIWKIKSISMECIGAPRSFSATYEVESFPFYSGAVLNDYHHYADTGLFADSGLVADIEFVSDMLTY